MPTAECKDQLAAVSLLGLPTRTKLGFLPETINQRAASYKDESDTPDLAQSRVPSHPQGDATCDPRIEFRRIFLLLAKITR